MNYQEIIINTDGGARGNPGPAAVGIVISGKKEDSDYLFEHSETIGDQTNNTAEYKAVIIALQLIGKKDLTTETLTFILDSELIVRQILGKYRVKETHLQSLVKEVHLLIKELKDKNLLKAINFRHVRRHENKRADQLVNQALDSLK
ncbi:hypothetical protein A3A84_00755 [Candidatus Collierbacteria bacterium RIFCSPLOWO2_01_FULL_50_23]|uniref:RNase H type-1 domain-containing protein n=2 Tax=Candidatus Collieribacteriota TaxID=1752725 RepID=A0A1F5EXL0_9BACT|nr:MAG: hypothetical protein A2703_01505 [Candidatus Collierbacteria bacterium RIFCSPHIGHO2_01_FULL_50_25]OGD72100.1 MAG: hypothetical protein A3D09_03890 [Candidatus Collierbacteria bacterium RIFCSPHIGHO2_02_FULL_49_10]OGD74691.1 MAG: hypothetical protein A3A84_00755 [Candidatus Collierbacteria bacterium RIFCSPLOWO2_01_FULL_50_23]